MNPDMIVYSNQIPKLLTSKKLSTSK